MLCVYFVSRVTDEMEDDADAFPQTLDQFVDNARNVVSQSTLHAVLHAVLADVCSRAEQRMLHYHYTRVSALFTDRYYTDLARTYLISKCMENETMPLADVKGTSS